MPPPSRIFRQAALDRLSSPEQLDQLMQVTTPRSWLALGACCVLVAITVAWGIWGSVASKVYGRGIIVKQGGVFLATARGEGSVEEITVEEEQTITNQQVLARLSLPELSLRIRQAQIAQQTLTNQWLSLQRYHHTEELAEKRDRDEQRQTYTTILEHGDVQVKALEERLQAMAELSAIKGGSTAVISKVQLLEVSNSLFAAQHELARTKVQLKQLELGELQSNERRRQQKMDKQAQIDQGAQALEHLNKMHKWQSEVLSPLTVTGTVLEIMVKSNQLVSANSPIMSLQSAEEQLRAWLFLTPSEGKRVQKGMRVAIAPASVKRELFGLMSGTVDWVSAFPVTPQLMLRVLENPALVSEFTQGGVPFAVTVKLDTLPGTNTFTWSSGKVPKVPITSGTLCDGSITLTNRSPISLVLPYLRDTADFGP